MTRIGLIADTHVGEYLETIPPAVFDALAGCELILHAGDLSQAWVLDELATIAPVIAVRGDHDAPGTGTLPRQTVVTVAGRRIGLIHGRRPFVLDMAVVVAHVLARRRLRWRARLHQSLMRKVGPVDCLVYGHWHEPVVERRGATLIVSPGAVCPWGSLQDDRPVGTGWQGVADRWVRRYRQQLGAEAMRPAVAILEVTADTMTVTRVPLDRPT